MRTASSTGSTKELAVADAVGLGRGDIVSAATRRLLVRDQDLDLDLGRKSTTYSAPR